VSTDNGPAIVVKRITRIFWAHKTSVAAFGDSETPIDVQVLQYAAEHDGNTRLGFRSVRQDIGWRCAVAT
jgi:hypothetical protein